MPDWRVPRELADLLVYVNGEFRRGGEAGVSVWDHGLLYGDGVFEGIRAYDGKLFKLEAHLDRLYQSAALIGLKVPLQRNTLREAVLSTVRENKLRNAHVRPIITRGSGWPGFNFKNERATVVILAYPLAPPGRDPIRCMITTIRRKSPLSIDAQVKSLNYLDSVLAKFQAVNAGFADAILLDAFGCLAEATAANLFLVRKHILVTPTVRASLDGITRGFILEIAEQLSIPSVEREVTPGELYVAEEAFLCGTGYEIVPLGEVDGRRIGDGTMGPVTSRIATEFDRLKLVTDVVDAYES